MNARRSGMGLTLEGADISRDVAPYLLTAKYQDQAHGKSDDLQLSLQDRDGRWRAAWFPPKGSLLVAEIRVWDWDSPGDDRVLPCGTFSIDEITASGPPSVVEVKAVSALTTTSLRREERTAAWENTDLKRIAGEIAARQGLELFWKGPPPPPYDRRDQRQESDLAFLQRLCEAGGRCLKVTDQQIVVFDEAEAEAEPSCKTIKREGGWVIKWSFASKGGPAYRSCRVRYHDPRSKEKHEHVFVPPKAPPVGHEMEVRTRVSSLAEAEVVSKKELRGANKNEIRGSLSLFGDPDLSAGTNLDLAGFGTFDGKYNVETVTHNLGASGYTCDLELHRVLEGY